ncbi:hypothetical protein BGX31_006210 [Mortierella sp. GBA43]|nr:hypothetical protein BGX31_006210 [Mortierella sp. GBA43]
MSFILKSMDPLVSLRFLDGARQPRYWDFATRLARQASPTLQSLSVQDIFYLTQDQLRRLLVGEAHEKTKVENNNTSNDGSSGISTLREVLSLSSSRGNPWRVLRHLTISTDCMVDDVTTWVAILQVSQGLESLELGLLRFDASVSKEIELTCSNSSSSSTRRRRFWPIPSLGNQHQQQEQQQEPPMQFPRLRRLKLVCLGGISSRTCLRVLIAQCAGLQSLCWRIKKRHEFPGYEFWELWKTGRWPLLGELEISGSMTRMVDHHAAAILSTGPTRAGPRNPLSSFRVPRSLFGELAKSALMANGHTRTLRELDLSLCDHVSSKMVRDILASSPRLQVFRANNIHLEDAARGEPWVCTGLVELSLHIHCGDRSRSESGSRHGRLNEQDEYGVCLHSAKRTWTQQQVDDHWRVFDRLAALERLVRLDLSRRFRWKALNHG